MKICQLIRSFLILSCKINEISQTFNQINVSLCCDLYKVLLLNFCQRKLRVILDKIQRLIRKNATSKIYALKLNCLIAYCIVSDSVLFILYPEMIWRHLQVRSDTTTICSVVYRTVLLLRPTRYRRVQLKSFYLEVRFTQFVMNSANAHTCIPF